MTGASATGADNTLKTPEQIKNALDWLISRLVTAVETMYKCKHMLVETYQNEIQKGVRIKKEKTNPGIIGQLQLI